MFGIFVFMPSKFTVRILRTDNFHHLLIGGRIEDKLFHRQHVKATNFTPHNVTYIILSIPLAQQFISHQFAFCPHAIDLSYCNRTAPVPLASVNLLS